MTPSTPRSDAHADPSAPVILGYATRSAVGPWRWRWVTATALGLAIGATCGFLLYEPMLTFIAQGQTISIGTANQFLTAPARFTIASAISGVVVACGAVAASGRRKMWFGWPILLAIVFGLGASLGLLNEHSKFDQTLAFSAGFSTYTILPRGYAPTAPNSVTTFGVSYRLTNTTSLLVPTFGCAAVLLVLSLLAILRFFGGRSAER